MDLEVPEKRAKLDNKVVSTGWFDLPYEMRDMILDQMDFKTLCVFAQCSKACAEEVKESERIMFDIALCTSSSLPEHLQLHIGNGKTLDTTLYYLEFVEMSHFDVPKTEVIYIKLTPNWNEKIEKWRRLENGKAEDVRIQYFDDFVDEYYENIYQIEIQDTDCPAWKYDMRKIIDIYRIEDYSGRDLLEYEVIELSQITNAHKFISAGTNVTFDQLIEMTGWHYELKSNEFDEKTIAKFLKMLKKGEFGNNLDFLELHLDLDIFPDPDTIIENLNVSSYKDEYEDGRSLSFVFKSDDRKRIYCELAHRWLKIYSN